MTPIPAAAVVACIVAIALYGYSLLIDYKATSTAKELAELKEEFSELRKTLLVEILPEEEVAVEEDDGFHL
jgi:hypothetical protein